MHLPDFFASSQHNNRQSPREGKNTTNRTNDKVLFLLGIERWKKCMGSQTKVHSGLKNKRNVQLQEYKTNCMHSGLKKQKNGNLQDVTVVSK